MIILNVKNTKNKNILHIDFLKYFYTYIIVSLCSITGKAVLNRRAEVIVGPTITVPLAYASTSKGLNYQLSQKAKGSTVWRAFLRQKP